MQGAIALFGISHLCLHFKGLFGEVFCPQSEAVHVTGCRGDHGQLNGNYQHLRGALDVSGDLEIQCTISLHREPQVSAWAADPFLWKMGLVQEERKRGLDPKTFGRWWYMVPHEGSCTVAFSLIFHDFPILILYITRSVRIWISSLPLKNSHYQEGSPFYSAPGPWPINNVVLMDLLTVSFEFPLRCRKMVHFQRHSQRLGGESMEWCWKPKPMPSTCNTVC